MKVVAVVMLLAFTARAAEVIPCRTTPGGTICVGMVKEQAPIAVDVPQVEATDTKWLHLESGSGVVDGKSVVLPRGRFKTEAGFAKLDTEVRRLQTVETSLKAENTSLREAVEKPPSLTGITIAAGVGFVGGVVVTGYLLLKR